MDSQNMGKKRDVKAAKRGDVRRDGVTQVRPACAAGRAAGERLLVLTRVRARAGCLQKTIAKPASRSLLADALTKVRGRGVVRRGPLPPCACVQVACAGARVVPPPKRRSLLSSVTGRATCTCPCGRRPQL